MLFAGWKRYLDTAKLCEAARLGQDRQGIRMNKVSNDSAMMCVCVFVFLQSEDVRSEGHNLAWEGDICRKHR